MDIEGRTIWQQAAGNRDRNYVDVCLRWSVILTGPGYDGPMSDAMLEGLRARGWSAKKVTNMRTFRDEIQPGHLVVLRIGTNEVHAVGEVVGGYQWSSIFSDVDGWDAEHVRRVRWLWSGQGAPKLFPPKTLKWGDTTQLLISKEVRAWLADLVIDQELASKPLPQIPSEEVRKQEVGLETIAEHMFDLGVSSASIERFTHEVNELVRIYNWYSKRQVNWPSEHETVAYLVVPLLRALGWTPQKMAVEWGTLDVALFRDVPRTEANLACVVEVKNLNSSCLKARGQAEAYAKKWGPDCRRLVVTDGMRYGVYEKREDGSFEMRAYMNLGRRFDEYPVYGDRCRGIRGAIMALTPERVDDGGVFELAVEREEEL